MTDITGPGQGSQPPQGKASPGNSVPGYAAGIRDVVVLELKQRLRSRGWYIMLGVWFVIIGAVTWLSWAAWSTSAGLQQAVPASPMPVPHGPGSTIFEAVLAFVLLFALLVTPALSANGVNGDRAGGTLAILQITLLTPGQILWGKFLAAFLAALAFLVTSAPFLVLGVALGGLSPSYILVSLLMLAVEIAVVCGLGTGISALASRPLFSIVVTYLAVAALTVLSVVAFGLGTQLTREPVTVMEPAPSMKAYPQSGPTQQPPVTACVPTQQSVYHMERVAWFVAVNPFVVVADAIPYPDDNGARGGMSMAGPLESISQATRHAMAGADAPYSPCVDGKYQPGNPGPHYQYLKQTTPVWPLGLSIQVILSGLLLWLGWRSLRTPARRLAPGTRIG